jgi:hypothetical protein
MLEITKKKGMKENEAGMKGGRKRRREKKSEVLIFHH